MSLARDRAKQILHELDIDRPELLDCLKEICIERGAYVREERLDHAEARLTVDGKRGIITVNPNPGYGGRTRFSIAHELGHFELHRKSSATSPMDVMVDCKQSDLNAWSAGAAGGSDGSQARRRHAPSDSAKPCTDGEDEASQNREREANEFASELLMPEEFILPEILHAKPSVAVIQKLAETYQTSLFASTRRFIDLTGHACASVFYRDGAVSYSWRSESFKKLALKIGGKLDPGTYAAQASAGRQTPTHMASVDAKAWFDVPGWYANETILEQARYFSQLGMGMSLIWIDHEILSRGF